MIPKQFSINYSGELIVDSFAGGGGTSTGIRWATGRGPDIAINHDPAAIAMHAANHPETKHYCESVWDVDSREATGEMPVGLFWLSPDCKHFSKAKGGKPVEKKIRGLAWIALRWAGTVKPRVIILENVEEFRMWGPLLKDGKPDPKQKGRTFKAFVNALKRQGYQVDYRELRACDYGAPTIRKRFFLIARCDGRPIIWPEPTHGDPQSAAVVSGKLKPWRTAAEIIDWSIPCPSIFERKRPLAENTLKRIAKGIQKFVIDNPQPFIIGTGGPEYMGKPVPANEPFRIVTENHRALVAPIITRQFGNSVGHNIQEPLGTITAGGMGKSQLVAPVLVSVGGRTGQSRLRSGDEPLATITTKADTAIVTSHLIKMYGTNTGSPVTEPVPTITAGGLHIGEVRTFLLKYTGMENKNGCYISNKNIDSSRCIRNTVKRRNLETCDQNQSWKDNTGSPAENRMQIEERLFGNCGMVKREAISRPSSSSDLDNTGGGNPAEYGFKSQGRKQNKQFSEQFGTCDAVKEYQTRLYNRTQENNKLCNGLRNQSEGTPEPGNVLLKNSGGTWDITDNSLSGCSVTGFLTKFYGASVGQEATDPLHTVTSKDTFGLVMVHGEQYQIVDIGMRMLEPKELFAAQGFPPDYIIDRDVNGKPYSKAAQVARCGNAVPPVFAEALIRANLPKLCMDFKRRKEAR